MNSARWLRRELKVFSDKGGSISRSAVCQARKKLKPSLFTEIDEGFVNHFYESNQVEYWKGMQMVAMDGTSLITNELIYEDFLNQLTAEEREDLKENHKHTFEEETQVHAVTLHDIINDICLGHVVDLKSLGEREMVVRLKELLKPNMVLTLDRGYPARWFFHLLQEIGVKFIIRMKTTHCKTTQGFFESGKPEQDVTLTLKGKDIGLLSKAGIASSRGDQVKLRLVRVEHEGAVRIFATNLKLEKATPKEIGDLYHMRWWIEKSYYTFKTYLKLEGWRIYSQQGLMMDFAIKILLYNLSSITCQPARKALVVAQEKRELKKPNTQCVYKLCKVYSIESLMEEILPFVTKQASGDIEGALKNYIIYLIRNPSTIQKGRRVKRPDKHKPERAHLMNRKTA